MAVGGSFSLSPALLSQGRAQADALILKGKLLPAPDAGTSLAPLLAHRPEAGISCRAVLYRCRKVGRVGEAETENCGSAYDEGKWLVLGTGQKQDLAASTQSLHQGCLAAPLCGPRVAWSLHKTVAAEELQGSPSTGSMQPQPQPESLRSSKHTCCWVLLLLGSQHQPLLNMVRAASVSTTQQSCIYTTAPWLTPARSP